ncbi:MAG: transcription elongation factor GreA [Armatimonadota bacterium]
MSEKQVVLTPAGHERILAELRELQTVRRHEVAENIRQAKAYGDIAENAEYEDAKNEQAFLEGRISELKNLLGTAIIIEEDEIPTDEVGIGSVVKVRDLEFNDEWEFTMVGSYEADPDADRISHESPIGEALFGKRVGDVVEANVPAGTVRYEILSIRRPGS